MANLSELIASTSLRFSEAGIASSEVDAELLLAHHLGVSRGELQAMALTGQKIELTPELERDIQRRAERFPLQHITGTAPFRNFELSVGPGVFIPRPETESVVDIALAKLAGLEGPKVLDIGTGSGAIAIALALESNAEVIAVEASVEAAAFAKKNTEKLAPDVSLLVGDFRDLNLGFESYDLIVSNPPYIPLSAVPVDPEVRDHDPELALYGGEDGLDLIRELIETAWYLLKPGGSLVLEHADGQSDAVCELLLAKWHQVSAHQDATGRYRAVSAVR